MHLGLIGCGLLRCRCNICKLCVMKFQPSLMFVLLSFGLAAPVNAAIIDSKGWLHFRTGEYKLALEYLRKAYALDNDPEIAAHLGEVLWEMGEQTEAQKFWFQALAVNPDSDALTDTMERFGQ